MNEQCPTLSRVRPNEVAEVLAFVTEAREGLFPQLAGTPTPADLRNFEQTYLYGDGCFLIARHAGRIVGAIGYVAYDGRFPQFDYAGRKVVEVVRLFVSPQARRSGLASRLYQALEEHAMAAGVAVMYLHTHPFLPGAASFWERQGFEVIGVDEDPVWRTIHMHKEGAK
jgi:GNAT superfamily N-acetyltransferase